MFTWALGASFVSGVLGFLHAGTLGAVMLPAAPSSHVRIVLVHSSLGTVEEMDVVVTAPTSAPCSRVVLTFRDCFRTQLACCNGFHRSTIVGVASTILLL